MSRVRSLMKSASKRKYLPGTKVRFRNGKTKVGIKNVRHPRQYAGAQISLKG